MEVPKQGRLTAFSVAFKGLRQSFRRERHMRIHGLFALLSIAAAWYFSIASWQLVVVLVCIVMVMSAELFNSAIEKICDVVQPEFDDRIGYIKDISSAAVLLCALVALTCGLLIFIPAIIEKWF